MARISVSRRVTKSPLDIAGPWEYKGSAIPDGSIIDLKGKDDLWAPDVHQLGDWYYLHYAVSSFGSQHSAIGVARSKSMDVGTWKDGGTVVTSDPSKPLNAIDPNLIRVNGEFYLNFGSSWQDIFQVHLSNPPVAPSVAIDPYQIGFTSDREVVEGSYLFHYGKYYYLFMSKGKCCGYDKSRPAPGKEYRILACRSSKATEGFVDKDGVDCTKGGGTVVLESHDNVYGPGGQGVYDDTKHGPVLYYHYVDTKIGYADGQKQFGLISQVGGPLCELKWTDVSIKVLVEFIT
ncbi:hypothetical protein PInf_005684 [Phytophthora infestans]|nr:hypothetical protein PInf_005684 [Phytophthora infestans]